MVLTEWNDIGSDLFCSVGMMSRWTGEGVWWKDSRGEHTVHTSHSELAEVKGQALGAKNCFLPDDSLMKHTKSVLSFRGTQLCQATRWVRRDPPTTMKACFTSSHLNCYTKTNKHAAFSQTIQNDTIHLS